MMPFADIDVLNTEVQRLAAHSAVVATPNYCRVKRRSLSNLDSSTYFQHMIIMLGMDIIDKYELTHVKALIFYGSRILGVEEKVITDLMESELCVRKIEAIQRKDVNQVIDFLRDFDGIARFIESQAG